jgi:hypothetical protein
MAVPAWATVVLSLSIEELTVRAPLVVRGTVHRVTPQLDDGRGQIWTYSEIGVSEVVKGPRRTTVLVKQPGGQVGRFGQHVAGAATFVPSEDVVLFLEPAVDEPDTFVLTSMSAAKVSLATFRGERVARRNLAGLSFVRPGQKGVIQPVDDFEVLGTAEAFLNRIRMAAGGSR